MSGLIKNGMILAKEVEGELWIKASLHNLEVKRAVDAEREACAKVCEALATQARKDWKTKYNPHDDGRSDGMHECSEAIRARGQE